MTCELALRFVPIKPATVAGKHLEGVGGNLPKTPPMFKNIIESYALDPNFQNLGWIDSNSLNYKD
jgi:hypothetical protein